MKKDILQYSIDVRKPIDEQEIVRALEEVGIEVIGIDWKASWTDEDYWKCKPPYDYD